MAVSVIMPAYNSERFIGEAIQSVLNQTLQDWELIVVNDCSSDNTANIIKLFSDRRIRLINMQQNQGPAMARIIGTDEASYEYVSYFDSDDRLCPRAFEVLSAEFKKEHNPVLVYADYVRIDEHGNRYGLRNFVPLVHRPSGNVLEHFLIKNNLPNGGCALVRKDAVVKSRCWNKHIRNAEDWVAWTLLATEGAFTYVRNFIALEYRELPTGLSQSANVLYTNMLPAVDAVYSDERIIKRFSKTKLQALRSKQEAHIWTYIAMLNVRKRLWKISLSCIWQAIRKAPERAVINLSSFMFAIVDSVLKIPKML